MVYNESCKNYNVLVDSFFDYKINGEFIVNVMLGGGIQYFECEDCDVMVQFIDVGYVYVDMYNKLVMIFVGENVLGLFVFVGLFWVLDDKCKNCFVYLIEYVIKYFENDNGFFLLVEVSQVDWVGYVNDIVLVMVEMYDFNLILEYLYQYVQENFDMLVVFIVDYSIGGLIIGVCG